MLTAETGGAPFCMLFVLGSLVKGRQAAETLRLNKTKHTYVGSMTIGRGRVGALALKVESDWSNKPSARNENAAVACCFVLSFDHKWYLGQIWLLKSARGKYKCVNVNTRQTNQKKIS